MKSFQSNALRDLLTSRAQLVHLRVQVRGILKPFGWVVGKETGQPFGTRVARA